MKLPLKPLKNEKGSLFRSLIRTSSPPKDLLRDQRGLSQVDSAVIFIGFAAAFVAFAAVVVNTGLLSSKQSVGAVLSGLPDRPVRLVLRGLVIGIGDTETATIQSVRFHVGATSQSGAVGVSLATSGDNVATVTYKDPDDVFSSTSWTAEWLTGDGPDVDTGETVEIDIPLDNLSTPLGPATRFSIEITVSGTPALRLVRITPTEITPVVNFPVIRLGSSGVTGD